ncbi:MAG: hypothetical protein ACREP8_03740, partial [Candidatus Binatia bacterium]
PGGKHVNLLGDAAALTNADGDPLIAVEEFEGAASTSGKDGLPVNKDHPEDMIADKEDKDNGKLTYNTTTSGEIHADYDDEWTVHEVTGPGPFTVHGESYADTYRVQYDPDTHTWTIYAYKGGDTSVVETFIIHGTEDTQVIIDAMGENMIVNTSDEAMDSVVVGVGNAEGAEGTGGSSGASSEIITNLLAETGKTEAQLLNALKAVGYPYETIADLEKAIKDGEFPPPNGLTTQFINFLYILDPEFYEEANQGKIPDGKGSADGEIAESAKAATKRLVELLGILYPDENTYPDPSNLNQLTFQGDSYHISYSELTPTEYGTLVAVLKEDADGKDGFHSDNDKV